MALTGCTRVMMLSVRLSRIQQAHPTSIKTTRRTVCHGQNRAAAIKPMAIMKRSLTEFSTLSPLYPSAKAVWR
jgi:hypothetical protein